MTESSTAQSTGDMPIHQIWKMGFDAFMNPAARTGYGQANMMNATRYPLTRLSQNYMLLNSLYRNNWLVRNVVRTIPQDALKNGHRYESDIDQEKIDKLKKMEVSIKLRPQLKRGLNWGRLYGGAIGLMMLVGQEKILHEPLDLDDIMPGDFKGIQIADRWSGVFPLDSLIHDIGSAENGLPEFYEFRNADDTVVAKVHHTRVVRFTGHDLPAWESQAEQHWGASIVEDIYEELTKRDNTSANIASLIFLANLRIYKMAGYDALAGGSTAAAKNDLYQLMSAINRTMNSNSLTVIGEDDEFQTFAANFSGLNEIYESFMMDMAGACQIPVTKLFGRSPAGMNSTGESDMRNYYDVIEGYQEDHLRPVLEKLLPVLCMSTLGEVPDDIEVVFNPIYTPSEKETADLVKGRIEALNLIMDSGTISDRTYLMECKALQPYGFMANLTDAEIAAADDKPRGKMPDMMDAIDVESETPESSDTPDDGKTGKGKGKNSGNDARH